MLTLSCHSVEGDSKQATQSKLRSIQVNSGQPRSHYTLRSCHSEESEYRQAKFFFFFLGFAVAQGQLRPTKVNSGQHKSHKIFNNKNENTDSVLSISRG